MAEKRRSIDLANRLTLRADETALVLGVSLRKLRDMLPRLPHFRDGGTLLFPVEGLHRFIAERVGQPSAERDSVVGTDSRSMASPLDGRAVADEVLARLREY